MNSDRQSRDKGFIIGILLTILGITVLATQAFTTLITVFFLGVVLFVGGILEVIHGFSREGRRSALFEITGGLINLVLGGVLIFFPTLSAVTLTLMIAVAMILLGGYRLLNSLTYHTRNRGWRIFGGLLTLLLGIFILTGWPASGLYIIGLFMGIQLLISGITTILIGTGLPAEQLERVIPGSEIRYAHDVKKTRSKKKKTKNLISQ